MGFGWGFSSTFLIRAADKISFFIFLPMEILKKWESFEQVEEAEPRKNSQYRAKMTRLFYWTIEWMHQLQETWWKFPFCYLWLLPDKSRPQKKNPKFFHWGLYKNNRMYLWRQIILVQNHYHSKMFSLGSVCLVKLRSLTKPIGASECWMAIF